jgi:hypothetical protein
MRLFSNPRNLPSDDINLRLRALDATASCTAYAALVGDDKVSNSYHVVAIDSVLSHAAIVGILASEVTVQEKRHAEYPSIGDQLDDLWHAMDIGVLPKVEPMYFRIKLVKDTNPKEVK